MYRKIPTRSPSINAQAVIFMAAIVVGMLIGYLVSA